MFSIKYLCLIKCILKHFNFVIRYVVCEDLFENIFLFVLIPAWIVLEEGSTLVHSEQIREWE